MIKKIFLILGLFLCFFMVGYSDTTITTCGGTYSNFTANEIVYIDLDNTLIKSGSYCIETTNILNNVTFVQLNDKIVVDVSANYDFIIKPNGNHNYILRDFYLVALQRDSYTQRVADAHRSSTSLQTINIYDSIFVGWDEISLLQRTGGGSIEVYFNSYNSTYVDMNVPVYFYTDGFTSPRVINYNYQDSALLGVDYLASTSFTFPRCTITTDGVALIGQIGYRNCGVNGALSRNREIIGGVTDTDVNDDNVGDNLTYLAMYIDVYSKSPEVFEDGFRIIQNQEEYEPFQEIFKNIIPANSDNLGSPNILGGDNGVRVNTVFVSTLFENFYGIELALFGEISNFLNAKSSTFDSTYMYMQDSLSPFTLGTDWKPLISIAGDYINITDVNFSKIRNTNNAHIIANTGNVVYSHGNINDNIFYKTDENYLNGNNYFIRLRANNLDISENVFTSQANTSNGYEYLYIDSTAPNTNNVYLNEFYTVTTSKSPVFTSIAETRFYNNYLGENVTLSSGSTGLDATPLVSYYNVGDETLYYWYIGNYYEDNTGCSDVNGDGFCDSPYTSGDYEDTHPLSSYPFDYTAHLLTAETFVDNFSIGIQLTGISNNTVYEIDDGSSILNVGFIHDSNFPDLQCDFVIDSGVVSSVEPAIKNINYTIPLSTWTEKNYTYRVECYNNYALTLSDEYVFTIAFIDDDQDGGGNGSIGDDIINIFSGGGTGLFTGDLDNDGDSYIKFLEMFQSPMGYIIILAVFFIILSLVILVFSLIRFAVTGGGSK